MSLEEHKRRERAAADRAIPVSADLPGAGRGVVQQAAGKAGA